MGARVGNLVGSLKNRKPRIGIGNREGAVFSSHRIGRRAFEFFLLEERESSLSTACFPRSPRLTIVCGYVPSLRCWLCLFRGSG